MKDGIYSFRLDSFGHLSRGSLTLRGGVATGGDTRVAFQGEITHHASNVTASLEVTPVARFEPTQARYGATDFSVQMSGSGDESQFDLIGVGPRGLIVAIAGEWMTALPTPSTRTHVSK